MNRILKDRSFKLSIILSLIFLGLGFALLHFGLAAYGWACFIVLPIVLGLALGALPNKKWAIYGSIAGLIIFFFLLYTGQLEAFVCVLMALPVIVPLIFSGSVISHLFQRFKVLKSTDKLEVLILLLLIFLFAAPVEKAILGDQKEIIEVESTVLLPYSPSEVYDSIKSVDTLDAEKPFLMKIDLPVPQKCVLEEEEVGALRTCYFEGGKIVERITELEKAGVETDEHGFINVNESLQTNIHHIWAMGDCNGQGAFTHTSYNDYQIVASHLFGDGSRKLSDRFLCYAAFIDPPLGRVGMNVKMVKDNGIKAKTATRPLSRIARAKEMGETLGFLKIIIEAATDKVLGASFLGAGADEYIHTIIDLMYAEAPYTVIRDAVHIHPTVSELIPTMLGSVEELNPDYS